MSTSKVNDKQLAKQVAKKKKRKKKTALIVCRDRKQFWTTQTQFWQWVREGIVVKTGEQPLTGLFRREHEELLVLLSNTVLNLAHPNHMALCLWSFSFRSVAQFNASTLWAVWYHSISQTRLLH